MQRSAVLFFLFAAATCPVLAQTSNTGASLAGVAAGAALGAGAGQGGTSPSSLAGASGAGGGGTAAPMEIEIMAYHGLRKIASDIAEVTAGGLGCPVDPANAEWHLCAVNEWPSVLIEDTTSANQIALYQAVQAYHDQLQSLHNTLQISFSLQVTPQSLTLALNSIQLVKITNLGVQTLTNVTVAKQGLDANLFQVDVPAECQNIPPNSSCYVTVTFTPPPTTTGHDSKLSASLLISISQLKTQQIVQLNAAFTPRGSAGAPLGLSAPTTTPGAATSSGAPSSSPVDLTYLSGIMTALAGLKSNTTYSPSSFQPTTQAFEVLIEKELTLKHISSYTSTSAINLKNATAEIAKVFSEMLAASGDISIWSNICKPTTGTPSLPVDPKLGQAAAPNPECNKSDVVVNLVVAQQMIAGYTSLLGASSDGSGNPAIVDVLRGQVLSDKMKSGIASLQVTVAAAGGSTRSNSFFLLNLFYLPKPSYNSAVIATFELRNKNDDLLNAGARTVLFDYNKKWKGGAFGPEEINNMKQCGAFCAEN